MQIRGVDVDHSTIQRWVFKFSPAIEKNMHKRKFQVGDSWRMDDIFSINAKGITGFSATIFNRWGQQVLVHELNNIKDISWYNYPIWDGRTSAGTQSPGGTYFYMINYTSINDDESFKKGSISLLR